MTIIETTQKLLEYFSLNTYFCIKDDFKKIFLITEDELKDTALLKLALKELVSLEIVKSLEEGGKEYYILIRPLQAYEQKITINGSTATSIANIINAVREESNDKENFCDATNITENNIKYLLYVIFGLTAQKDSPPNEKPKKK
jgi:hypothetical protein